MDTKEIKRVLDSEAGQAMKDFLLGELMELRNIDNVKMYKTSAAQTIEIKSQRKTFDKLRSILEKLMTIQDMEREKSEKDQYFSL